MTTVRPGGGHLPYQRQDFDRVAEVERAGRLVEEHDRRLLRQDHREPAALALTAGEVVEAARGELHGAGGVERAAHGRLVLARPLAEQALVRVAAVADEPGDGDRLGGLRGLRQAARCGGRRALASAATHPHPRRGRCPNSACGGGRWSAGASTCRSRWGRRSRRPVRLGMDRSTPSTAVWPG